MDNRVNISFSSVNTCELNAITNSTLPKARLHINTLFLTHKVFSGISMLVASSFTQKRIALNTPSTRTRTILSLASHDTARCTGVKDAPPSCFWKTAVTSNSMLFSVHQPSHDLSLTPYTRPHIS